MNTNKHELKIELRSKISAALENFSPEKRESDSQKLCRKLRKQSFFQNAASVLFFAPLPNEVDLWPLLEKTLAGGKVAVLPCFDSDKRFYTSRQVKNLRVEILSGQFGIREPSAGCVEIPTDDLDLILVPGIAFDLRGNRLGRGKGFYDRLLEKVRGAKCGIAFDEQIVNEIKIEPHDMRMDFILTPTRAWKS
ncbi:MAG: 5-formyltetrahydrofolate cyclo-ligase [Limisphaerales bacterium]